MIAQIDSLIKSYSSGYLINQLFVILMLFVLGITAAYVLMPENGRTGSDTVEAGNEYVMIIGFPLGLAIFEVIGCVLLIAGIPYNRTSVLTMVCIVYIALLITLIVKRSFKNIEVKKLIVFCAIAIVLAIVAVSGYIKISVSNDSLYYFWQYPRAICYHEGLRDQFDNFLTDTGLGASVVGSIPFLFGFGETFGIQEFFHMNFVMFFGYAVYDGARAVLPKLTKKKAVLVAVLCAILFATCTPVYILAHWAMSNVYFMELFFICLWLCRKFAGDMNGGRLATISIFATSAAFFRMEGGIFILLLAAIVSLLSIDGKYIAMMLVPVALLQGLYELKIFTQFEIDHPYTFMTKGKALIQFVAYVAFIVYILFIRDRLPKIIKNHLQSIYAVGFLGVNGVLLMLKPDLYINNLRAFAGNLFGQSGWGMVPYLFVGVLFIIVCLEFVIQKRGKEGFAELSDLNNMEYAYWIYAAIGFFLIALAVSFARGDDLNANVGDSGNRVLLQGVAIVIYGIIAWIMRLVAYSENLNENK